MGRASAIAAARRRSGSTASSQWPSCDDYDEGDITPDFRPKVSASIEGTIDKIEALHLDAQPLDVVVAQVSSAVMRRSSPPEDKSRGIVKSAATATGQQLARRSLSRSLSDALERRPTAAALVDRGVLMSCDQHERDEWAEAPRSRRWRQRLTQFAMDRLLDSDPRGLAPRPAGKDDLAPYWVPFVYSPPAAVALGVLVTTGVALGARAW